MFCMLVTNYFNVTQKNHKENNKMKRDVVADSASHVPTVPIHSKRQERKWIAALKPF